ncbi:hypothetical protein FKM82_005230 [Ascaphus truei]
METSDWQTVPKKKGMKKPARKKEPPHSKAEIPHQPHLSYADEGWDNLTQRIHETMERLRASEFWDSSLRITIECLHQCHCKPSLASEEHLDTCKERVDAYHLETGEISPGGGICSLTRHFDCVCYGLGNFSSCVISRHQLAFLLLLLEQLQISVLKKFGLTVILDNEEGKRAVCGPTVFYMLHCGKALYNNVLWRNWSQEALSKMIIIGNSFKGFQERLLSRILQRDYAYIQQSLQALEEIAFTDSHQYSDMFNDTSIHWFPLQKLGMLPSEAWQLLAEPDYQECDDLEIIRNQKR